MRDAGLPAERTSSPSLWLGFLLGAVGLAYSAALSGPFQFDDYATVAVDRSAQSPAAWWANLSGHVRPLLKASFLATYALGEQVGNPPLAHHLGNLLIHLGTIVALYRLGRRVIATCAHHVDPSTGIPAAIGAAAVFGLHPIATEAVSYIIGRSMSLGTLLAVLSLLAYIRARTARKEPGCPHTRTWMAAAMFAYAAAVLTRETMAVLPLLYLLWEWARRDIGDDAFSAGRFADAAKAVALPAVLAGAVAFWMLTHLRYAFLLEFSRRIASARLFEPSLIHALEYFASGFALLRYPNIDPDVSLERVAVLARLAGLAVIIATGVLAWRLRRTRPHLLFGLAWVLAWLAPLYAVQVRHDPVAERHFYPALWGPAFVLSLEWALFARGGRVRRLGVAVASACAGLALLVATATRNSDYRTEVGLWEAAMRSSPAKLRVLNNLGVAYMEVGRWDDAEAVLRRAVEIDPGYARAQENLLRALHRRPDEIPGAEMPP